MDAVDLAERAIEEVVHSPIVTDEDEIDFGDSIYQEMALLLNSAIEQIGMGKYQWQLFCLAGFGYFSSNLALLAPGLLLPPIINEFKFSGPLFKVGQSIGILAGAAFWGAAADVWGRKISFDITFLLTAFFTLAAGASTNWITLTALSAVWSVGAGGNLPVDSAIFLEFVPRTHQYLLTVLSIWWGLARVIASLIAWGFISTYSCAFNSTECPRSSNEGWRYFLFTLGGIMIILWGICFFLLQPFESPKFLMGRGESRQAVEIVHQVAKRNGKESTLTLEAFPHLEKHGNNESRRPSGIVEKMLAIFDKKHLRALFATRKLAWSTTLLIVLWALIGLAFPLYDVFIPFYLARRGSTFGDGSFYTTYRDQVILSLNEIPGSLLAGYLVEHPVLGRRGTLSLSTILTGIFILGSTTARNSNALLGWNCAYSFTSNLMYGVLFAITPELFPTKARGTGSAITATAGRLFGVLAPIVALYADLTTSLPVFISGAIFLVAGVLAVFLPYESRGRASL